MNWNKKNKWIAFTVLGLFTITGTYNAVVINSESHISSSDVKFVKRLDEIYGITVHGREVAASVQWHKIAPTQMAKVKPRVINKPSPIVSAPAVSTPSTEAPAEAPQIAAVQEELNMSLVEVINPNKYKTGLVAGSFNGELSTNNGIIESLNVALPNGEGLSVSFSEMTGNVFEYDMNGELYSGMMYQVDQHAYMVTLTNGPLEGTRLRFATQAPEAEQQEVQNTLAENNNVDVGNFGNDQVVANNAQVDPYQQAQQMEQMNPEQIIQNDQQMQQMGAQAQGFNFASEQM